MSDELIDRCVVRWTERRIVDGYKDRLTRYVDRMIVDRWILDG